MNIAVSTRLGMMIKSEVRSRKRLRKRDMISIVGLNND